MHYIFLHGLGQDSLCWDQTTSMMGVAGTVLCPDLFAFLDRKERTYANLYTAFAGYCNAISGPLHLCGLSLGAMLAMNYAVDYPDKVQSLVLIGAQHTMPKMLLKFQNIIFHFMPERSFTSLGMQKRDVIQLTQSMMHLEFRQQLKGILCPTLILCGERDTANKKAAKEFAESVPHADLHWIEHAGHEVNVDAPDQLAPLLDAFWLATT